MKIIFVARRAYPQIGGVEKHILQVSRELERLGHKVRVISESDIKYPKIKFLGLFFIWIWVLRNQRLFKEYDIVHAHDVTIWLLPLKILQPSKPLYSTFHGWEGMYPIPVKNKWLRRLSAKMSKRNICIGKFVEKYYGIKANEVTYGGAEKSRTQSSKFISEIRISSTTLSQNFKSKFKIAYVGRLDEDAGVRTYLKALDLVKKKQQVNVEFIGDGKLRNECEKYGIVHGFVKDPGKHIESSYIVLTSGYLSMLEALSFGKVVFATYNNPLKRRYLVNSPFSKYVVVEKHPELLASKILSVIKNPAQGRMLAKQGQSWASKQTWRRVGELYLKIWSQ